MSDGDSYDVAAYRRAHEDAQRTLDKKLATFDEISTNAWQLIRFNGLVVAAIGTGLTVSKMSPVAIVNAGSVAGALLLVVSTVIALWAKRKRRVTAGPGQEAFEAIEAQGLSEVQYLWWITTDQYPKWIAQAETVSARKAKRVNIATYASLLGVATLVAGILFTLYVP
ncbi:hypothetical protein U3A55_09800 [Salarchaeum sp. III]|uniref:hypothetical protein n=1 Tax=Salarchaeum sp. III TaxID=3107927 RepID=UPI002EDA799A